MPKREAESPEFQWEAGEEPAESDEPVGEFGPAQASPAPRPGFHLQAARKIEEARERKQLRKAIEDFDDYDV